MFGTHINDIHVVSSGVNLLYLAVTCIPQVRKLQLTHILVVIKAFSQVLSTINLYITHQILYNTHVGKVEWSSYCKHVLLFTDLCPQILDIVNMYCCLLTCVPKIIKYWTKMYLNKCENGQKTWMCNTW